MQPRHLSPSALTRRLALSIGASGLATAAAGCAQAAPASTALPNVHVLPPLKMSALNRSRIIRIYLPPSYETRPDKRYPVIYMHDGQNLYDDATAYAGEWGVDEAMNDLALKTGFEAIVVGIDNGQALRLQEYVPWPHPRLPVAEGAPYLQFVVEELKPWVDAHYRTRPEREATGMIGSSLGGLITHYALFHYPEVIGRAGVFSPSYWVSTKAYDEARELPLQPGTRVYLYMGGQEDLDGKPGKSQALEEAARMAALLQAKGLGPDALSFSVQPDARHNEKAWRNEFPKAVAWLYR